MLRLIKKLDTFSRNILIVFLGSSVLNFFNLLYQLLIAHRLSPPDFAAFNSLISIFILITSPFAYLQAAISKYVSEFSARGEESKLKALLSNFFIKSLILSIITLVFFFVFSSSILRALKIDSIFSGYMLAGLLAFAWMTPVIAAGAQGMELFSWYCVSTVTTGVVKLGLAAIFLSWGFGIPGSLCAFLISCLVGIVILYIPIRNKFSFRAKAENIDYKEILIYFLPVALSSFCFMAIASFDMVLVKYFFTPQQSGEYSLAQMVGKIFLFLPGAISFVMFPRAAGLNAKNADTSGTLKKSLLYGAILCLIAVAVYNIFPKFVLKVLTGKVLPESVMLGRLFSVSMTFFTLTNIIITYFLSLKDMRFLKFLLAGTVLQFLGIILFHTSLKQVQFIMCVNAVGLFIAHLVLLIQSKSFRLKAVC